MIKRILLALCLLVGGYFYTGQNANELSAVSVFKIASAANKPSVGITPRELKKDRNYETSDLYARAHHLIYGKKGPLGPDGRVRIALVINGDESIVVEDRIKNCIYQKIREKFPRESFAVMKGTDVNTMLLEQAENERYDVRKGRSNETDKWRGLNNITNYYADRNRKQVKHSVVTHENQDNDIDGMVVVNRPRGLADMRLSDYVNAGRKLDYDYVLVLTMSLGEQEQYNRGVWPIFETHTSKQNIWLRARFVDVKEGSYVYRNDLVAKGKTHNGHFNGRLYERSVAQAVQEMLNDVTIND